ncbi:hypothetical protein Tco_1072164 [Tanacetum coccineum]
MFSKKKTPKSKTPNSRLQPSAPHLTPDPNFLLSGVSPPIRFRSHGFEYTSQLPHPPQNNNIFYQNRPLVPPYNNPNAFYNSPTGLYRPTMESSTFSQPNKPYSPINHTNLDMNFEELIFSKDYNYSQDYSMGHGSGHGSAHGSPHGSDTVHDDEDDSPVEEVSPVKPKKPSRCATRAKKDELKEPPKDWTMAEETALCQAWCDVSENNIDGNSMKSKRFWDAVIRYFEKETGSSRGYDSIVSKWKNKVHLRIGVFCAIIKNVEANHESSTNDLAGRKKSKTSETTSGSASGGLNLNEEADEAVEETQEFRLMGRDRAKAKKKAAGSSRGESSSLIDLVADKFFNIKQKKWGKKDEQQQSYIEFKNQELSIREAEIREIAQLKREKLEIQRRTLELAEREKRDRDILFYNSLIDPTLPPIQQQKLLEMKLEIKERYNLDY